MMDPVMPETDWSKGDFSCSELPVEDWVPTLVRAYRDRVRWHEATGDDAVPYVQLLTGTGIFASAFGCEVHLLADSPPFALPVVSRAEEADRLPYPTLNARPIERVFRMIELLRRELGDETVIGVPDIQSPFDIAALIWRKEDLFCAMYESPESVKRLTSQCQTLLTEFLDEFKRQVPNPNLIHCPYTWAPPELGCSLSEDEAGSVNQEMFEEFCLPSLVEMSEHFGGMFVHCCATADHQYEQFNKIPNLRGINRVFQAPGPRPAIEAFENRTVLVMAWLDETAAGGLLDQALPGTRFLFNISPLPIEEAKRAYDRLRERCPRT